MPMIYVIFKEIKFSCEDLASPTGVKVKYTKRPVCLVKTNAADKYLNKAKLRKVAAEFFGVPEASVSVL